LPIFGMVQSSSQGCCNYNIHTSRHTTLAISGMVQASSQGWCNYNIHTSRHTTLAISGMVQASSQGWCNYNIHTSKNFDICHLWHGANTFSGTLSISGMVQAPSRGCCNYNIQYIPACVAHLDAGLANVDGDTLAHLRHGAILMLQPRHGI